MTLTGPHRTRHGGNFLSRKKTVGPTGDHQVLPENGTNDCPRFFHHIPVVWLGNALGATGLKFAGFNARDENSVCCRAEVLAFSLAFGNTI